MIDFSVLLEETSKMDHIMEATQTSSTVGKGEQKKEIRYISVSIVSPFYSLPVSDGDIDLDDVGEVMKVLTEIGSNDVDNPKEHTVDRAELAEEKLAILTARQAELEKRFADVSRRIGALRTRNLGSHVATELAAFRTHCKQALPPLPSAASASEKKPSFAPPKINSFSLPPPPLNVPNGIVLPDVPVAVPAIAVTEPVKREPKSEQQQRAEAEPLTAGEKERAEEALGQLEANVRHLVQGYDSEATESSSGGESCDEYDRFPHSNSAYVAVKKRAKYAWLSNRADIASKWTWLTAQISDLEYKIRQQTEFYRQIRAAKGAVTLGAGEPVVSWPPHARKPVTTTQRADADVPVWNE